MTSHSNYLDNNLDFWEMRDLLQDYELNGIFNSWSAGRLENWRYRLHSIKLLEDPTFLSGLARLWRDECGRLTGLAISEDAQNDIFVFSRLGQKAIEREIYEWIDTEWSKSRKYVETFTNSEDTARKELLVEFGYTLKRSSGHTYKYDLNKVQLDYRLEPGYVVQDITVDRNFRERAVTIHTAFNPDKPFDEKNVPHWESTRGAPSYRPRLELAAVGSDGGIASACLGWVDERNHVGEVEPIATHPSSQQRGFAKAMVTECFKRMKEMGMEYAYIGSGPEPAVGNRLYESLNPAEKYDNEMWVK